MSTTKMAISQSDDPLDRRFVKLSCPGVSIIKIPGTRISTSSEISESLFVCSAMVEAGKKVAPIC